MAVVIGSAGADVAEDGKDNAPTLEPRVLLTRFLGGEGVELGPGHHPFPLPLGGVSVRYVDRWEPSENRDLFPELGEDARFPEPDIVANLDTDRLKKVASESQDFVIASHVLEHLAEPLGQIEDIYRVLRYGGTALIVLPDRRYTFDRSRRPTALGHLVEEYEQQVTTVADDHIEDFLRGVDGWSSSWTEAERRGAIELHRKRSIHVHCWTQEEFFPVIEQTMMGMGMRWELLETLFVGEVPGSHEFGVVLRKTTLESPMGLLVDRLRASWLAQLRPSLRQPSVEASVARIEEIRREADAQRQRAEMAEARLDYIRALPGYAAARGLWRAQRSLRSRR